MSTLCFHIRCHLAYGYVDECTTKVINIVLGCRMLSMRSWVQKSD